MEHHHFRPHLIFHWTRLMVGLEVGRVPHHHVFTRSSSKAEIVSLLESSQEKERSQQQHKAEMAFRLMDRNNDGYITKQEMLSTTKKLSQKQVRGRSGTKQQEIKLFLSQD